MEFQIFSLHLCKDCKFMHVMLALKLPESRCPLIDLFATSPPNIHYSIFSPQFERVQFSLLNSISLEGDLEKAK